MIVTTKTTIGFAIPDEYKQMMEFAEETICTTKMEGGEEG